MADESAALTLDDAAREIAGLLTEDAKAKGKEGKREVRFLAREKAKVAPKEEVEEESERTDAPLPITATDGTPDPGEEAEEAEPDAAKTKVAAETDDTEEEKEEVAPPRLLRIKVDGIEQDVDEEEVKRGYSRTADYTRKTQALAAERAKWEAEEVAPVREERRQYADRLAALAAVVQLPGEEPDWGTLRDTLTPEEFTTQFTEWRVQQTRMEKIRSEQERVEALHLADTEKRLRERLQTENAKLATLWPDWADPAKGKARKDDLVAYAKSLQFTDDDIAQVSDHRLLLLLDKARRFAEAQKRKPKIEEKIDRALETIKPSSVPSKSKIGETERAQRKLAETGRVEDAAILITKMLEPRKQ